MRLRTAPSGPEFIGTAAGDMLVWNNTTKEWVISTSAVARGLSEYTNTTGTVIAAAAAGDSQLVSIPTPGTLPGDIVIAMVSVTLVTAGMVIQGGICLAPDTMALAMIATKAYAGAVVADINVLTYRP
jgi:hypothetical protein